MRAYNSPHALPGLSCHLRGICYFESTYRHWEMRSDDNNTAGIRHFSTVTFLAETQSEMAGRPRAPWKQGLDKIACSFLHLVVCAFEDVSVFALLLLTFVNATKEVHSQSEKCSFSLWCLIFCCWKNIVLSWQLKEREIFFPISKKQKGNLFSYIIHIPVTFCLKIHITNNQLDKYVCFSGNILHGE